MDDTPGHGRVQMYTQAAGRAAKPQGTTRPTASRTRFARLAGVISGMEDNRSNAFVEAMNGLLLQAKRAVRGFRTATNFIARAYLRMSKLSHQPDHPLIPASQK